MNGGLGNVNLLNKSLSFNLASLVKPTATLRHINCHQQWSLIDHCLFNAILIVSLCSVKLFLSLSLWKVSFVRIKIPIWERPQVEQSISERRKCFQMKRDYQTAFLLSDGSQPIWTPSCLLVFKSHCSKGLKYSRRSPALNWRCPVIVSIASGHGFEAPIDSIALVTMTWLNRLISWCDVLLLTSEHCQP